MTTTADMSSLESKVRLAAEEMGCKVIKTSPLEFYLRSDRHDEWVLLNFSPLVVPHITVDFIVSSVIDLLTHLNGYQPTIEFLEVVSGLH